jgi:hypothetical protein
MSAPFYDDDDCDMYIFAMLTVRKHFSVHKVLCADNDQVGAITHVKPTCPFLNLACERAMLFAASVQCNHACKARIESQLRVSLSLVYNNLPFLHLFALSLHRVCCSARKPL